MSKRLEKILEWIFYILAFVFSVLSFWFHDFYDFFEILAVVYPLLLAILFLIIKPIQLKKVFFYGVLSMCLYLVFLY